MLAVNGEIYNHQALRQTFEGRYPFRTHSDCEVILPLYREKGPAFLDELNGIFAFALYDEEKDSYLIARDHIGIIPLYMGHDPSGTLYVASEVKALTGICNTLQEFPPGHYLEGRGGELTRWYQRDWFSFEAVEKSRAPGNLENSPFHTEMTKDTPEILRKRPYATVRTARLLKTSQAPSPGNPPICLKDSQPHKSGSFARPWRRRSTGN